MCCFSIQKKNLVQIWIIFWRATLGNSFHHIRTLLALKLCHCGINFQKKMTKMFNLIKIGLVIAVINIIQHKPISAGISFFLSQIPSNWECCVLLGWELKKPCLCTARPRGTLLSVPKINSVSQNSVSWGIYLFSTVSKCYNISVP